MTTETLVPRAPSPARRLIAMAIAAWALLGLAPSSAPAAFGVAEFDGEVTSNAVGAPAVRAGSHPYAITTKVAFNTIEAGGYILPDGGFKDVHTLLPEGIVGNPHATRRCSLEEYYEPGPAFGLPGCPNNTAVGFARIRVDGAQKGILAHAAVFNMSPRPGLPARFAFRVFSANVFIDASVRTGEGYGIEVTVPDSPQPLAVTAINLTLWGVPSDPSHDSERGSCMRLAGPNGEECSAATTEPQPFLSMPTSCVGPTETSLRVNSWQEPENWQEASFLSHDAEGNPVEIEGCDELKFQPSFQVQAQPGSAGSPSGLRVQVDIPQDGSPEGRATSQLRKAVVTLPEGMTVNAAAANGRDACSFAQVGIDDPNPVSCPSSSRLGSVEIVSPLLASPLEGSVYLAKQGENPFGSTLAMYLVAEAEGVFLKLPGKVEVDPATGQIAVTFDESPQLPFSHLDIQFFGGPRAALVAPEACGTYVAAATFSPWSGTAPVTRTSSFTVDSGPNGGPCPSGGFTPTLNAGTVNPIGGNFSPFTLQIGREDGMRTLSSVDVMLPPGLLGKLAGIPYCPDGALAAIPATVGTGVGEAASPSCPAASRIGFVSVSAGTGPDPVEVPGKAYLAGPYKGAPLSLAVVTPAVAGPLDLGNVVVRTALHVDPLTAQVRAISDQLPTILAGIPLNLRDIRVNLDRDGFTLNPTSCDPMSIAGQIAGSGGATAPVSQRFQAASCASLGFQPKLSLRFSGATHRGAHPKLKAVLTPRSGDANLEKAVVTLPKTEFLENSHIRTICTRVQYAGNACPAASVYGYAQAWSPLLNEPLQGPVYLRSSDHKLPDLVAALDGQIHLDLPGRIDSPGGRIRTTFWAVPDAPVSKFVLTMQGGKKGLLVNNSELCRAKPRAKTEFSGQNGKRSVSSPLVKTSCGKR
jgi:hypothetical protein